MLSANEPVLHCPTCGYNLTGLPQNRCPECGRAFSPCELRRRTLLNLDDVPARALVYYGFSAPLALILVRAVCVLWDLPKPVLWVGAGLASVWAVVNAVHWAFRVDKPDRLRTGRIEPIRFLRLVCQAFVMEAALGGSLFVLVP